MENNKETNCACIDTYNELSLWTLRHLEQTKPSNTNVIKKILDMYLFKFRLLEAKEQNKTTAAEWIYCHWDDYEDTWPFKLRTLNNE